MFRQLRIGTLILSLFLLLAGCETDPVIYLEGDPVPVIYGIISINDSTHYIKVGKSFGAIHDPIESARIYDSLFFKEMVLELRKTTNRDTISYLIEHKKLTEIPKDAGIFHFPGQEIYSFNYRFGRSDKLLVKVKVPGLPIARAEISLVAISDLNIPFDAQQYVYLVPTSPLRIQWEGGPWNEIDVAFEFIEHLGDSVYRSRWVHIQNTNSYDSQYEKYREMNVTYDEFIMSVLQQIEPDDEVKDTFIGYISITIHEGDDNMVNYMKYLNGYTDFNVNEFSNIENGIGLLASRSTLKKDSLRFDYVTRQTLINERRLKVLKISPWN